ncbi:MAG TPA: cysteine methyltransferase [Gemmatimonadetes bacterium]|nr:cysteine methyltransferase [Gemmatimonadota bacterium]HBV05637.1 cysteine methyltransferase [Gemmatimonadota bacterium]
MSNLVEVHSAHLTDARIGGVTIWTSPRGVRRIEFGPLPRGRQMEPATERPGQLREAVEQMEAYFAKERKSFQLPLDFSGVSSDFQREVYEELLKVKHGHVTTYGEIARAVGKPDQARAVGQAVGANPILIVVPCHRVIASDGRLTGFSGGLRRKVALLRMEGVEVEGASPNSRVHPEVIPLDL